MSLRRIALCILIAGTTAFGAGASQAASVAIEINAAPPPPRVSVLRPPRLRPTHQCGAAGVTAATLGVDAGTSCFGCGYQPSTISITKKPTTYATATCQPARIQAIASLPSGYMFDSATPADDPNQIIEPPKPTA